MVLLRLLDQPIFVLHGAATSVAEAVGFLTGVWCVLLVSRQSVFNFPVGIANSAMLCLVFYYKRLFGDAALQIFFLTLGFHGWWEWLRGGVARTPRQLTQVASAEAACLLVLVIPATLGLQRLLISLGGAAPLWDALVTTLSLAAQWLMNRKKVQSWIVWIVVDLISVPLYVSRELYVTALLYAIFLGLALRGYVLWRGAFVRSYAV